MQKLDLHEMTFKTRFDFDATIPGAALRYNTLLILRAGTPEAIETFKHDLIADFGLEDAKTFVTDLLNHHNARDLRSFGGDDQLTDSFNWEEEV